MEVGGQNARSALATARSFITELAMSRLGVFNQFMNRTVLVGIVFLAFALSVFAEESTGKVFVQTIPFGAGSNWKTNDSGATERSTFAVQIDERTAIKVTTNSAGAFANLPLAGKHLVKIKVDGKPLTSFHFSFEGRSNQLMLRYNEFYGTWSLVDIKEPVTK
jgi:hypothetical protein